MQWCITEPVRTHQKPLQNQTGRGQVITVVTIVHSWGEVQLHEGDFKAVLF